jgi:hypothetical protein
MNEIQAIVEFYPVFRVVHTEYAKESEFGCWLQCRPLRAVIGPTGLRGVPGCRVPCSVAVASAAILLTVAANWTLPAVPAVVSKRAPLARGQVSARASAVA